ncbi:MAG: DUF2235 domain-containing protein, partial [Comamonadaceae bacterium]|nr:DUF2235 domain-containing protein [Comamonadaceae bacterium]
MSEIYNGANPAELHPARTLPVGESRPLTVAEYAQINSNLAVANALPTQTSAQYSFLAAFDGTGNDRANIKISGNVDDTVVARMERLVATSGSPNAGSHYEKGVGTDGFFSRYVAGSILPTEEANAQAHRMYDALLIQAKTWAEQSDGNINIDIAAMGFSRGCTALLAFGKLLDDYGIPDIRSRITVEVPGRVDGTWETEVRYSSPPLVPPGAKLQALMIDPVGTGVKNLSRLTDNFSRLHVDYASNEYRRTFAAMSFSNPRNPDPRVTMRFWPGAHSDLVGAYSFNGISGAYGTFARRVLLSMGTPVSELPNGYEYIPETARVHDSAVGIHTHSWVPERPMTEHWSLKFSKEKPASEFPQIHPSLDELVGGLPIPEEWSASDKGPESTVVDSGTLPSANAGEVDNFGPPLDPGAPWPPFIDPIGAAAPPEGTPPHASSSGNEVPASATPQRPPGWSIADAGSNVWTDGGPFNSYGEGAGTPTYKAPPTIDDLIPDFLPEAGNAAPDATVNQAPSVEAIHNHPSLDDLNGSSTTPREWDGPREEPQPGTTNSSPPPTSNAGQGDSFGPPVDIGTPQPPFTEVPDHAPPAGQAPSAPAPAPISNDEVRTPSTPEQPPARVGDTGGGVIPRGNPNNPYGYTPDFTEPESAPASNGSVQAPASEGEAPTAIAPARPLTPAEVAGRNAQTAASTFTTMLSTL